ncbi:Unknown protein, partial [Striga hermonthica]
MDAEITEKLRKFELSDKEKLGAQLSDTDVEPSLQECERSLIGLVVGEKKVNIGGIKTTMGIIWRTSKPFSIRILGLNLFQFMFQSDEDKIKVLRGKTWSFDGQYMLLNESLFKEEEMKVELWVQVHNLPIHWISHEIGIKVGKLFGKVQNVIVLGVGGLNGRVVKILAEINLLEPILRGTMLKLGEEEHWVDFRYENLQTFCFYCGMIGHSDKQCEIKKLDVQRDVFRAGQFGEWLRGISGGSNEQREMRASSPVRNREISNSNITPQAEKRVSPEESQQVNNVGLSHADYIPKESEIGDRTEPDQSIQGINHLSQVGNECAGYSSQQMVTRMDLDVENTPERSSGKLVNVPVVFQQDHHKTALIRQTKLLTRITKSTSKGGKTKPGGRDVREENNQDNVVGSKRKGEE